MPSIQLDKILENISFEKSLYKNEEKTKKDEDDAWKRVATNNNITIHEAKAIYNVLIRKFNTEKSKGNSTWKMYQIMRNIQEGKFALEDESGKQREENEGMIELMEVFEEEDSASEAIDGENDKSNGSSNSKASGNSTRSTGSLSQSPEIPSVTPKKLLNTDVASTPTNANTLAVQKTNSPVFIPPNLQKVNLRPVGGFKKDLPHQIKRKADSVPTVSSAVVKRPAMQPLKPQLKSVQPQSSSSTEKPKAVEVLPEPQLENIKFEPRAQIKTEPISNGYFDSTTNYDANNDGEPMRLPPDFFQHLCSSNRHESFGLYLANFLNRLEKSAARNLEIRLLRTITEFQMEHEN